MPKKDKNENAESKQEPAKKPKKGSKEDVWNGHAVTTSGGLKRDDLTMNKRGKVVSKKKSDIGKQLLAKQLNKPQLTAELSN